MIIQTCKRTVRTHSIRIPLYHSQTEQISKRMRRLVLSGVLSEDEHGKLFREEPFLRKADRGIYRFFSDRGLPETALRPVFWNVGTVESIIGWVLGLREYVESLEQKYFLDFDDSSNDVCDDDI